VNKRIGAVLLLASLTITGIAAQEERDALAHYRDGEYEEAIAVCLEELEAMPRRMDAHVVLGWSLLRLGRYEEALERGREAYRIAPGDYRIIEILGEANFYLGNNLRALQHFEEYAVLAPTGDRIDTVYYFMGEIFIRLGEYNHADISFTTAVYHSPNIARWWSRLGYAREMAEDYVYALEAYNQALELNPSYNEALRGKERVMEKMQTG
jgi:tetratricopeptide (TPR) repeat protein